jgi:cellulose synthase (UDP-forming)
LDSHDKPKLESKPIGLPRWRAYAGRCAGVLAATTGAAYLTWRLSTLNGTGGLGVAFYVVETLNYLSLALTACLLWRPGRQTGPPAGPQGTLDVFITACGEPAAMVEETLRAALAIDYPHRTYVLNDGLVAGKDDWREIEALARRYGVSCFTRSDGVPGKAGNLNHALARTRGELVAVIDADHRASPGLAHATLGYFTDADVAFVCTPQHFGGNADDPSGSRELLFYGSMQPAKDAANSAFSCGSGVVYRRRALVSIGGFSEWSVLEDLHTSLELHAAGWKSVYHPWPLSTGIAPQTSASFVHQRLRWATDSLRIFFWRNPLLERGLTPLQRLHYLQTTSFYLVGATQILFILGPILYLLWRVPVMHLPSPRDYLIFAVPYLGSVVLFLVAYGGIRGGLRVIQQTLFLSPVYCLAVLRALVRLRFPIGVTEKGRSRRWSPLLLPQLVAAALCAAAVASAVISADDGLLIATLWATFMVWALGSLLSVGLPSKLAGAIRVGVPSAALLAIASLAVLPNITEVPSGPAAEAQAASHASAPRPGDPVRRAVPQPRGPERLAVPRRGAYVGFFSPDVLMSPDAARRWSDRYGVQARIVNWYQQWLSGDSRFHADWLELVAGQGAVPMITWEPWAKPKGGVHQATQPRVRLALIAAGRYDRYIRSWARQAAAYRGPLLLRFMHEMNGNWYPWSIDTNGNTAKTFVAAWRHVHDLFTEAGATNVSWVWTINTFAGLGKEARDIRAFYPGDAYVDWVSMTGFNWGTSNTWNAWQGVDEIFRASYRALARFRKPIMISEIGTVSDGGDAARWIRRSLARLQSGYPDVKAVVWFDSPYPGDIDFRLRGETETALRSGLDASAYWDQPLRLAEVSPAVETRLRIPLDLLPASHAP